MTRVTPCPKPVIEASTAETADNTPTKKEVQLPFGNATAKHHHNSPSDNSSSDNSSSASSGSVGFISDWMEKEFLTIEDRAEFLRKLNKSPFMQPGLVPTFGAGKMCSMGEYESQSAIPSPLHLEAADITTHVDEEENEADQTPTKLAAGVSVDLDGGQAKDSTRLDSGSTISAGDGNSAGSDMSLRNRFLAETSTPSSSDLGHKRSMAIEGKIDQLLRLSKILAHDSVNRDEEMGKVQSVLASMINGMDRVAGTCLSATENLDSFQRTTRARDAATTNCLERVYHTISRFDKVAVHVDNTLSGLIDEFQFFEAKQTHMVNNVDAIEFQVNKIDSFASDATSLAAACSRLSIKMDKLMHATETRNNDSKVTYERMETLELAVKAQNAHIERLGSVEQRLALGTRVASLGNRFKVLEEKIGGHQEMSGGVEGSGLWKSRGPLAVDTGSGYGSARTSASLGSAPLGSAGSSSAVGLWSSPDLTKSGHGFPRR